MPIHDASTGSTRRRKLVSAGAVAVAAMLWSAAGVLGQDDPLVKTEPIAAVIQRTQKEKPAFAKRQQDLLARATTSPTGRRRA